ncbi:MAG: DegV family protein [Candidatus Izemoplasmatales bacterium]|jgi:DegV family protein with EDD domain|nr:DegV family protein [Candidatus Izemoplasmatales bacterium]
MKIAILTDSGSNLSAEFIKKHTNLFSVPLLIMVDEKSYRDQIEISAQEVYEKIDTHHISTSLPILGDLLKTLDEIKTNGFTDVIVINISSGLSGTYNSFRVGLKDYKGLNIIQYDSKTLGGGEGFLVEYALELVEKKTPIKDFIPLLNKMRFEDSMAMYTINTLKYLRKGGRIGKVEGTIGDILHIKPVITVNDEGVYITLSKAFGLNRSLISMRNILVEKFENNLIDLIIHYGDDPVRAKELGEKLTTVLNVRTVSISQLTPVLGVHTGADMFAYIARKV